MEPGRIASLNEAVEYSGDKKKGVNLGQYYETKRAKALSPLIYSQERHGLLFGPTGTGKTTRWLMSNLLGDSLDEASVVVNDPKGELAAVTAKARIEKKHKVKIIDPFGKLDEITKADERQYGFLNTHPLVQKTGFDPLRYVKPDRPTFYDDMAAIGEALIQINDKDPHWSTSAEGLLVGLCMWQKFQATPSLEAARKMLTDPETATTGLCFELNRIFNAWESARNNENTYSLETIVSLLARFKDSNDEINSIRSTADTQTRWLLSKPMQQNLRSANPIDFAQLKKEKTTVYIIMPAERMRTHSAWVRLVIVSALRALYSSDGLRTYFLLDEMPALGALGPLSDAFAIARGFRIQIVGIAQDLVQLKDLYKDRYESFLANAGFLQFFTPNDLTTADWMARRAGNLRALQSATGTSWNSFDDPSRKQKSENWQELVEPLFQAQELMGLPTGRGLLWLAGLAHTVHFQADRYDQNASLKGPWPTNPYDR